MKQTLVSLLLCLISILSAIIKSYAQDLPKPVSVLAPTTLQNQVVNLDVSLNTGCARPTILLRTISYRGIDINLALTYNGSGIRLDDHPGWVGQNWSLSAGGCISRMVVDLPDELTLKNTNIPNWNYYNPDKGFFYHYNEISSSSANDIDYVKQLARDSYNSGKGFDYEPDVFSFSFLDMTGSFFMGNDGKIKVSSKSNLTIVYEDTLIPPLFQNMPEYSYGGNAKYPETIAGFKIIDGNGTIYVFGYDTAAIEYCHDFFDQSFCKTPWIANSWYLTKIIDRYGIEIYRFEYNRYSFVASFHRTDYWQNWDASITYPLQGLSCGFETSLVGDQAIEGFLQSPVYLSSIRYVPNDLILATFNTSYSNEITYDSMLLVPRYNITASNCYSLGLPYILYYLEKPNPYNDPDLSFLQNLRWRKLDNITVLKGNYLDKFEFVYNNNPDERLNLEGVNIVSGEHSYNQTNPQKYQYTFEYYNFSGLPGYLSKQDDHWGYYRGGQYDFNPSNRDNFYYQRVSDPSFLQIGLLERINYPTGGYAMFEFEQHSFSQVVVDDGQSVTNFTGFAGGVRIKSIKKSTGERTDYKYIKNYNNYYIADRSGILAFDPKYYWDQYLVFNEGNSYYHKKLFSINSMMPFCNYLGDYINYSEVVELNSDNSFKISHFSSYSDLGNALDEPPIFDFALTSSPFVKRTSHSFYRGKLTEEAFFDGDGKIVRRDIYNYCNVNLSNYFVIGAGVNCDFACDDPASKYYFGTIYKLYYFDYDLASHESIDYLMNDTISSKTSYTNKNVDVISSYGTMSVRLLESKNVIISDDEELVTSFSYPVDMPNENYMQDLIDGFCIDEAVIETKTLVRNSVSVPVGIKKFTYKLVGSNVVKDKSLISSTDETDLVDDVIFDKYSNEGLLLQYSKHNSFPITLLWDNTKNYLMAEIENSQYSLLSTLNYKPSDYDSETLFNSIQTLVPNATIKTYSYKKLLGLISQTNPSGQTTYYEYDLFGRLKYIKNHHGEYLQKFDYHYKTEN